MRSNDKFLKQRSSGSWGMLSVIYRVVQRYSLSPSPSFHPRKGWWDRLMDSQSTKPQLSRLLPHPRSSPRWCRGVCVTGSNSCLTARLRMRLLPHNTNWRLEGEDGDSLGTQSQLPVIGAHPLARPAAKNRVGHGTGLGGGRGHTCKKQTPA